MSDTHTCEECRYFRQHYVPHPNGWFTACGCGHCVYPMTKPRRPETPACKHFEPLAP